MATAFCGIDWADDHHDVALIDHAGNSAAREGITEDLSGSGLSLGLLAEHDSPGDLVSVAIETSPGLLVSCLRATGRPVYVINPLARVRYRDRHSIAHRKSDRGDALVLADVLRTDAPLHRSLPADSGVAQAVGVLARRSSRTRRGTEWTRTTRSRNHLHQYFPGFLSAFAQMRGRIMRPKAASHPC